MATILLLNGPNLNLLGKRKPEIYGQLSLPELVEDLKLQAEKSDYELVSAQSNGEGELIDHIHKARLDKVDLIIFNPAAYTHTSIAIRDALEAVNIPFVEIHISNIHAREDFRKKSYFSDIAIGTISGFGILGYTLALTAGISYLNKMR